MFNPTPTYDSCIYRPGGTAGGDVFTTWAAVKTFIESSSNGKCIVFVDDSIVSPALVDGATGITDCKGRVEFRPYVEDTLQETILQVQDGATLRDVYKINGMEIDGNCQSSTPSFDFTLAPDGGNLYIEGFGAIGNAPTSTQPIMSVPTGKLWQILLIGGNIFVKSAASLVNCPAGAQFTIIAFDGSTLSNNVVQGAGTYFFNYDNSTANSFSPVGTPPTNPSFTGTTSISNLDNIWAQQPIDAATFNAPSAAQLPIYALSLTRWRAVSMHGDATIDENGLITVSGGSVTLAGNTNGPSGTNRFLQLVQDVGDADASVPEATGWWWMNVGPVTVDRTITLPADPTNGQTVVVSDTFNSLDVANINIDGNGHTIQTPSGSVSVYTMTESQNGIGSSVCLVYDANSAIWFIFAQSNTATGITPTLTGNVNGPITANRFVALMLFAANTDVAVPANGWYAVDVTGLTASHNVTLPVAPVQGQVVAIYDQDGSLGTQSIVVQGSGKLVQGGSNLTLDAAYPGANGGVILQFNGSNSWNIVADYAPNATGALVGNTNGPAGANRFQSLTMVGNNADVNVTDTRGWYFVRMVGLTANHTVTLPAAPTNDMVVVVKDGDGSLANFDIVINGNGQTIDGDATYTMSALQDGVKGSVGLQYDASAPNPGWFIF